jgi:hypothetical protein
MVDRKDSGDESKEEGFEEHVLAGRLDEGGWGIKRLEGTLLYISCRLFCQRETNNTVDSCGTPMRVVEKNTPRTSQDETFERGIRYLSSCPRLP